MPAEGITDKGWHAVQRLNVGGTLTMCETAYELAMQPAKRGTIVNVTVSRRIRGSRRWRTRAPRGPP